MALPLALLMVLGLTIAVFGVIDYSATGTRNASLAESRQEAKAIAEGAFNSAVSIVAAAADPAAATLPGCTTWSAWATVAPGEDTRWCGTYDSVTRTWTVKGKGRVANPTGSSAGAATKTVEAQLELAEDNGVWNFVWLRSAPGKCITVKNSFGFSAPLYVVGCLKLENDAVYNGPHLYVTDYLWTAHPTAGVGSAANPVPNLSVRDRGCRYRDSGTYHLPCTTAQNVWYDVFDRDVPPIPKPPAYLRETYDAVAPGNPFRGHTAPRPQPPHLLFIYAGIHDPAATSILIQSDSKFQGGLYAAGGLKVQNNGFVHGPAVADQTEAENGASFNPWPWFVDLPAGVESGMESALRLKPGSWRG